jgi:hypothetical protein
MGGSEKPLDRMSADRVIQRAIEIEAQRAESMTEEQVRAIAAELSISPMAVEQALAEQRAAQVPDDHSRSAAPVPARWYLRAGATLSFFVLMALVAVIISRLFP